jgi:hypothetical protein
LEKSHLQLDLANCRMALMEIRMLLSALVMKYESWIGVPDKPGNWDEEMKPFDVTIIHPKNNKCVLELKQRSTSDSRN